MRPSPTVAVAAAALVLLANLAWLKPDPALTPDQAAQNEGHGGVRIEGQAREVRIEDGVTRFELHGGGAWLPVRVPRAADLAEGAWIQAEGSLSRSAGRLTLFVASPASLAVTAGAPAPVPLGRIAEAPQQWTSRAVVVEGTVSGETLGGGEGHRMRIAGPRPGDGALRLEGTIGYEPACLCFVLHPAPWTS